MRSAPPFPAYEIRTRYREAPDFAAYLDSVEANHDLWHGIYLRARVPEDVIHRAQAVRRPFHLLALSEDWCGDAVNVLPWVARLAETVPSLDFRLLDRDANPDLMDAHLTDGRSRSIPVVMVTINNSSF